MIVAIHQPHYLPWLRYVHKIASCDVFVLLDDVQYTKNGWQNRNKIKGAQGPICLTIPVRDPVFKPLCDVEVCSEVPWREKHWKSLVTCYHRAPFFRRFAALFEGAYGRRWDLLTALNCHLIGEICAAFGLRTSLVRSSTLGAPGRGTERLVRICRALGADRYLTGAYAASHHLDERLFADAGIAVEAQVWQPPVYRQQFPRAGFVSELSCIDLLFNEGPSSAGILLGAAGRLASVGA